MVTRIIVHKIVDDFSLWDKKNLKPKIDRNESIFLKKIGYRVLLVVPDPRFQNGKRDISRFSRLRLRSMKSNFARPRF